MQRSVVNLNLNVGSDKPRVCLSVEAEFQLAEKSQVCVVGDKARRSQRERQRLARSRGEGGGWNRAAVATGGEQVKGERYRFRKGKPEGILPVCMQPTMRTSERADEEPSLGKNGVVRSWYVGCRSPHRLHRLGELTRGMMTNAMNANESGKTVERLTTEYLCMREGL